jgi:hypothetical protein
VTSAVLGDKCLGAAFIACATSPRAATPVRAALYSLRIAVWAFVAATVALVVVAFAFSTPQPPDGGTQGGVASGRGHGAKMSTSEPMAAPSVAVTPPAAITPPATTTPLVATPPAAVAPATTTPKPPDKTTQSSKPTPTISKGATITPSARANGDGTAPIPSPATKPNVTPP